MAFEHEIRVTWGDCDPAKVVYTARLPAVALDAVDARWEHHIGGGLYDFELDRKIGMSFVNMSMDFKALATPRHRLICSVAPNRFGTSSIGFHVEGCQDSKVCFAGDFVSVFVDPVTFKKTTPPDFIRAVVAPVLTEAN